ncbi:PA2779 family protein [Desulfohalovibrio reitneri]|uniref:PA2779 family protein n=1 Tax=Desulfohalovibrio reitneri TaxID=1307759 RepID=UPI0004A6BA7B|nr:PA2779 family protein [Desulfohalovibrio reitneri]
MREFLETGWFRSLAAGMAVVMCLVSFVPRVEAGFVPSDRSLSAEVRTDDLATVQKSLENKMVRERLADLGYSPEEIEQRLSMLSDQELHSLASQIDAVDSGGILGAIIVVLIIVLVVIVVLKVTDKQVAVEDK